MQLQIRRKRSSHILQKKDLKWPIDPDSARVPEGWPGWPGGKKFALVLTHDVEGPEGVSRVPSIMALEEERGFRSSFNFVVGDYEVPDDLRSQLLKGGFEIGVHGLHHNGLMYLAKPVFRRHARGINEYLAKWRSCGFRSPAMHHNLEWIHELDILYDSSTFDTDPFEPQPDGVRTIFPFWMVNKARNHAYVELPYTLAQDFTLFVILKYDDIAIWKKKLDWIAAHGGMALLNTHPDYMCLDGGLPGNEEYTSHRYLDLLRYIESKYKGQYWHPLPEQIALYFSSIHPREDALKQEANESERHLLTVSTPTQTGKVSAKSQNGAAAPPATRFASIENSIPGKETECETTPIYPLSHDDGIAEKLQVSYIEPAQFEEWDAFVDSHHFGSVYHSSNWKRAIENAFHHIKGEFICLREADSGRIVAGLPLYFVKSWLLGNRMVSIPFASFCDPLVSNRTQMEMLVLASQESMGEKRAKWMEIRASKTAEWLSADLEAEPPFYHHYIPLSIDPCDLFRNFSRCSVQKKIRKAIKHGVVVSRAKNRQAFCDFYVHLVQSRKRLGLPAIPFTFFDSLWKVFGEREMHLFEAKLADSTIGALLALRSRETLHLEYIADERGRDDLGINRLLYWEAIQFACSEGCRYVSFGRTSSNNRGLREYKLRWGSIEEPVYFFNYRSYSKGAAPGKPMRQRKFSRWLISNSPVIVGEQLGRFLYRHHG